MWGATWGTMVWGGASVPALGAIGALALCGALVGSGVLAARRRRR